MSRAAESETSSTPATTEARGPATGAHDRRTWIRLLATCRARELSGLLEVTQGRRKRTLSLVAGRPVHFDSDVPEDDLARTLVVSGLVPSDRLNWLQGRLGDGESLQGALVMSGAIERDQLAAHRRDRIRLGIVAPLQWGSGTWKFSQRTGLQADRIDPRLLPDVTAIGVLAEDIGTHVDLDTAVGALTATGALSPGPHFAALVGDLALPEALADLPGALAEGDDFAALMGRYPSHAQALAPLLWMMLAAGLIADDTDHADFAAVLADAGDGRPAPEQEPAPAPAAPRKGAAPSPAPRPRGKRPPVPVAAVLRMVQTDHADRRGRDAYAFLDVQPDADAATIKKAGTRLVRRWKAADRDTRLPSVARGQARELLRTLKEVRQTLLDEDRRQAYDLANGLAASAEPASPGAAARALLEAGEHKKAMAVLHTLRQEHPSDPDVLADLGWATWHVRRAEPKGVESAEEYLKLALTFDARHRLATERLARIALARGDRDAARPRLERVVKLDPQASWAKSALAEIEAEANRGGGGLGSWLRGGRS